MSLLGGLLGLLSVFAAAQGTIQATHGRVSWLTPSQVLVNAGYAGEVIFPVELTSGGLDD